MGQMIKGKRFDEITSKGMIEFKVILGNMVMRKLSNPVIKPNHTPEQISEIVKQTSHIQKLVDTHCLWWSYMSVQEIIHTYEQPKFLETINGMYGIDFDVKKWISDSNYYKKIFNENRQLHSLIFGYNEFKSLPFLRELQEFINDMYVHRKGLNDDGTLPYKDGGLVMMSLDYWCDVMEGQKKKDVDKIFNNLLEMWNDSSSSKYEKTPFEKMMTNTNYDLLGVQ